MRERGATTGAILALALLGSACGHPEQKVVDQYFGALNANDNQTLSSFAAVSLDTKGQKVEKWTITTSSPEKREPAPLPDLVKKAKDADQAVADNKKAANAYALDNLSEVDQVRELLRKSAPVPAKLAPVAEKWEEFNRKDRELKKAAAEAKDAMEAEKRNTALSVGNLDDLEDMTGELISKTLDLEIGIGGQARPYVMTLRKYEMNRGEKGPRILSRWIIYQLEPK